MAITGLLQSFCQCQMMQFSNHSPLNDPKIIIIIIKTIG